MKERKTSLSRRDFIRASAGAAAAGFLAACTPGGATPQVETVEKEVTVETITEKIVTATPEPGLSFDGTMEFWDWSHEGRAKLMKQFIEEFQAQNPSVGLDYVTQGWGDTGTKLTTAAAAGNPPPFSNVHVNWRYDLQRAGLLSPYPEDMWDWAQLVSTPYLRDPQTDEIYTCTFNYYGDILFYNQEILEAEGISPEDIPTNWDDFIKMAQQLTKTDGSGKITQVGCGLNHYWSQEWLWNSMVYQQGDYLYNEDGTEARWNSEAGVRAMQLIQDWYHEHQIDDNEQLRHFEMFGNEDAAMFISHGYWGPDMDTTYPQLRGKWGASPIPTFTGEPEPAWGMVLPEEGLAVFNSAPADAQEAAFAFIDYAVGEVEHRLDWALAMLGPPDRQDLLEHPRLEREDANNVIGALAATLPWRVNYGERPSEVTGVLQPTFDEVIINTADPQEALDNANEQMNAALAEAGVDRYIVERRYQPPGA